MLVLEAKNVFSEIYNALPSVMLVNVIFYCKVSRDVFRVSENRPRRQLAFVKRISDTIIGVIQKVFKSKLKILSLKLEKTKVLAN